MEYLVAYNEYGGVVKRVLQSELTDALDAFEQNGTLYRGVWELRASNYAEGEAIDVRLAPQFEIDGHDNNWRNWPYSFVVEH